MHNSTVITLMFLMFGQFVILMCGAFVLWLVGDFGNLPTFFKRGHPPDQAVDTAMAPCLEAGMQPNESADRLALTSGHSIQPPAAAGRIKLGDVEELARGRAVETEKAA